jgi:hypothetical protein
MHRQLYDGYIPECVEDAYTSLAAYNAASPSAKKTALRIIESRVSKLVSQTQEEMDGICSSLLLDTLTHLSRTQALFIYQLVRLFDGDIRSRAQAEGHMETLDRWGTQLLESAQLDCAAAEVLADTGSDPSTASLGTVTASSNGNSTSTSTATQTNPLLTSNLDLFATNITITPNNNPFTLPASAPPATLYKTWLLSESIRRIYIASIYMQSIYQTLKRGWSVCPGGIAFTAQSGLWDASGCYDWVKVLRDGGRNSHGRGNEMDGGGGSGSGGGKLEGLSPWVMLQGLEAWRIPEGAVPGEVDEFAVAVAEIACGVERVEQWVFEKGKE